MSITLLDAEQFTEAFFLITIIIYNFMGVLSVWLSSLLSLSLLTRVKRVSVSCTVSKIDYLRLPPIFIT